MKTNKSNYLLKHALPLMIVALSSIKAMCQQDPEYTQYMFNTMSVNPAYAGSKDHTVLNVLARSQWVNLDGAPQTQTLSYDTSIKYSGFGVGFNLVNDKIGPASETYLDANMSYALQVADEAFLSLGLKFGGRMFNVDWGKGRYRDPDRVFEENINNKFLPTFGAGVFYYTNKFYIGASVSNLLNTEHYDAGLEKVSYEENHVFLISGYVFDLHRELKFKPAVLVKGVANSPLSVDMSANFLYLEKFRGGISYRWDDAISALLGFQVSDNLQLGYAYDLTTSNLTAYNSGTHEVMLRYEIFSNGPMRSPRFF